MHTDHWLTRELKDIFMTVPEIAIGRAADLSLAGELQHKGVLIKGITDVLLSHYSIHQSVYYSLYLMSLGFLHQEYLNKPNSPKIPQYKSTLLACYFDNPFRPAVNTEMYQYLMNSTHYVGVFRPVNEYMPGVVAAVSDPEIFKIMYK